MSFKAALTLVVLCTITGNSALLFHGDNIPGQTTTLGPLGKDATLSLLVKNVLDLEARVRSQEQEIQTLKNQKASDDNVSANTLNKLMSKYIDMTTAFVLMKQEFNRNNNQTGLQTLKTRLDTIAQSVRYLTLSQQILHEEIQNFTNTKSADIYQLEALLSEQQANVTTMGSELLTLQNVMQSIQNSVEVLAKIRLVGEDSNSGLLEILYLGQWATVCIGKFDNNAAKVVCRMLGKPTANAMTYSTYQVMHFGQGTSYQIFRTFHCNGSEEKLDKCPSALYPGVNTCSSVDVAGVKCG